MMKENKVDKLFKAKASQGNFAFDKAHWAAAEKMLDAQASGGAAGGGFKLGLMSILIATVITLTGTLVWMNSEPALNDESNSSVPTIEALAIETESKIADDNQSSPIENQKTNSRSTQNETSENTTTKTSELTTLESQPKTEDNLVILDLDKEEQNETNQVLASSSSVEAENNGVESIAETNAESFPEQEETNPLEPEKSTPSSTVLAEAKPDDRGVNANESQNTLPVPTPEQQTDDHRNMAMLSAAASSSNLPGNSLSGNSNQKAGFETMNGSASIQPRMNEEAEAIAPAEPNNEIEENKAGVDEDAQLEEPTGPSSSTLPSDETGVSIDSESGEDDENIEPFKWSNNFTYSIGAEFGYFFNQRQFSSDWKGYESFRNANESQNGSLTGGLSFQLGYRNWTLNTGVFQYSIREDVSYPSSIPTTVGIDESYYSSFQVWSHTIDSTWVIQGINQGGWQIDTNWSVYDDSVYVERWDSAVESKENPIIAQNNGIKTISYAEVPVLFGRSFKMNKLVLDLQAGMAFGFLTKVEGAQYINRRATHLATTNQVDQFNNVVYSGMLRVGVRFGLSRNLEAGLYPSLRYTFNSVLNSNFGDQRYLGYGLQFGLYYRL